MVSWGGALALAVFVPHPKNTPEGAACRETVLKYVKFMDKNRLGGLAVGLLYSNYHSATLDCNLRPGSTGLEPGKLNVTAFQAMFGDANHVDFLTVFDMEYPTNMLRNMALNMVQTNAAILTLDVDFTASQHLHAVLTGQRDSHPVLEMRSEWAKGRRQVVIVPAFERKATPLDATEAVTACKDEASECWIYGQFDVPLSKAALTRMVKRGAAEPFYWSRWSTGHACWEPMRWLDSSAAYVVNHTEFCEPYIVALRDALPAYDERFRGKFRDKVSFLATVAETRPSYVVLPEQFLMHLPHERSVWLTDQFKWRSLEERVAARAVPLVLMNVLLQQVERLKASGGIAWSRQVSAQILNLPGSRGA